MKRILVVILISVFCFSCKNKPVEPIEKPEGYQEDIPWPSLADSPWPMFQGNPFGTNRTKAKGPSAGIIEWINESGKISGGLTLGTDNDLYIASKEPSAIYKVSTIDGSTLWKYDSLFTKIIDLHPCPVILKDRTIIATTGNQGHLLALSPEGKLKWIYNVNKQIYNRGITITNDGLILFTDRGSNLNAVNLNGDLVWKFYDSRLGYFGHETPVFSPDGKILYLQGNNVGLVAFDLTKKEIIWTFGNETWENYPLVDNEGHIYILSSYSQQNKNPALYCLNPDGSVRWMYEHASILIGQAILSLSMNHQGEIFFSNNDEFFCIAYDGKIKYKKPFGTPVPILIDGNDDMYILSWENKEALKLNRDGEVIWRLSDVYILYPGYSCISESGQWIISDYQYNKHIVSIK